MITQYKDLPLNIYRASAGSGKTHLLTGFYIKLLFDHELTPETHSGEMKFSEILAVTFTNKATAEMKGRIIKELFVLSTQPTESDYWEDVVKPGTPKTDGKAAAAIRKKAMLLLVQILNEYSSFNISTIDSFFQKIVRSFARELNIPGNYEVELDSKRVIEAAVTNFLDSLSPKTNPRLFNWMKEYTRKRTADGAGWDVRADLFMMAEKVLCSEAYKQHSEAIRNFTQDHEAMQDYADMLVKTQREWSEEARRLGEAGVLLMRESGMEPTDYKKKSNSGMSIFAKWAAGNDTQPTKTFIGNAENPDGLYSTKHPSQEKKDEMQRLMQSCVRHFTGEPYRNYCTAKVIRAHFYELGILAYIDQAVIDYCNDQNVMLLSSTTEMLSRLIDKDDAPFIYEKTGTRIHSFMIDEFQDTSSMQWGNFMPLVSNALSEQYQNLIVGDVKQSIYRWRGGDWHLLNSEINNFEQGMHYDDTTALGTNWRSLPAVVKFNNDFFVDLAKKLDLMLGPGQTRIQQIYADVEQNLPGKRQGEGKPQGLVHIDFLRPVDEQGNAKDKPKKTDYQAVAEHRLLEAICKLQDNGFMAKDIAVLCRTNDECQWAAEAILKYKHENPDCPYALDIISGEALKLSVRPVIHTLISLMRNLQSPDSNLHAAIARTSLLQLEGHSAEEALAIYFAIPPKERAFHPELASRPLYELTEQLISYLPISMRQEDAPFLQAFRDIVLDFASKKSSDLTGFLEWWDIAGYKKSITTPEGQNAIQIMTVHTSKGLGMPAIIMPWATWDIDLVIRPNRKQLIWCEPKTGPFSREVLLPIELNKKLQDTIFNQEYLAERECTVIDNINTVYVAFTRAMEALVIFAPMPSSDDGTKLEHWLNRYCKAKDVEEGGALTLGSWERAPKKGKEAKGDEEEEAAEQTRTEAEMIRQCDKPQELRSPADDNVSRNLPDITILHTPAKPDVTAKEKGNYIHTVLQYIRTADQAESTIHQLYLRGVVNAEVIDESEMRSTIGRLLSDEKILPWFRSGLQVLNELTLMDEQGKQRRPDRIIVDEHGVATVIDYKTGEDHNGYRYQVRHYMQLLRQIGFKQVKGYLLFIKDGKVVSVR